MAITSNRTHALIGVHTVGWGSTQWDWGLHGGIGVHTVGLGSTWWDWGAHGGIGVHMVGLGSTQWGCGAHGGIGVHMVGLGSTWWDWGAHGGIGVTSYFVSVHYCISVQSLVIKLMYPITTNQKNSSPQITLHQKCRVDSMK